MRDTLATVGGVLLVAVCCLLPLLIVGGISVVGGAVWREAALILVGLLALTLALGGAAVISRRRARG